MNYSGTAEFDWTPPKQRVADELNGEVFQVQIIVPSDVTINPSYIEHQVRERLAEVKVVEQVRGLKFRCVQIHIHYPDPGEYISHSSVHDEPDPH